MLTKKMLEISSVRRLPFQIEFAKKHPRRSAALAQNPYIGAFHVR